MPNIQAILAAPPYELSVADYACLAAATDQPAIRSDPRVSILGLFGEAGSLLSEVKKLRRDAPAYRGTHDAIREELGDVIWYLMCVTRQLAIPIEDLLIEATRTAPSHSHARDIPTTFSEFERILTSSGQNTATDLEAALMEHATRIGQFVERYGDGTLRHSTSPDVWALTAVWRTLAVIATHSETSLSDAAHANLAKIFDRWPLTHDWPSLFDTDYPEHEQLPRYMRLYITEVEIDGRMHAQQWDDANPIGDPLTDNKHIADDYRFHDVFHLGYAAILGWSPVIRHFRQRKRKTNPAVDENEDGARARIVEEGISAWIFRHAEKHGFFADLSFLDYSLLKSVREFAQGYESSTCPLWLWEYAILEGYRVFRHLRANRAGYVTADLNNRTLTYDEP